MSDILAGDGQSATTDRSGLHINGRPVDSERRYVNGIPDDAVASERFARAQWAAAAKERRRHALVGYATMIFVVIGIWQSIKWLAAFGVTLMGWLS